MAVELNGEQIGRVRLRYVPDFSADSQVTFVEACVESGSRVRTDGWQGYAPLEARGYRHTATVIGKDPARASRLLPAVHRVISLLKRWLLGTHHGRVEAKHLQAYLDEFCVPLQSAQVAPRGDALLSARPACGPDPSRHIPRPDQASAPPQQVGVT